MLNVSTLNPAPKKNLFSPKSSRLRLRTCGSLDTQTRPTPMYGVSIAKPLDAETSSPLGRHVELVHALQLGEAAAHAHRRRRNATLDECPARLAAPELDVALGDHGVHQA